MTCPILIQFRQRLAQTPGKLWSARHSQHGCRGEREAGAAPPAPHGAAPNPVSTVDALCPTASILSHARPSATAVLTTFEGQAVFRVADTGTSDLKTGDLFRLRKGSRLHAPGGTKP